ncbi:uncharacterized protein LOC110458645 isoform X2 [Mizuhopecten yessoensis]|uniref:uncharacterized protein LOC110458645 isoform X2 n=1 Tax=Mizuhopecten yessoensis TaxID=6573 RepID=UPI000B459B7B|nr:uncharacterized protein LOC110458645 isoform X2 [Mizuhopecten yessoensis]
MSSVGVQSAGSGRQARWSRTARSVQGEKRPTVSRERSFVDDDQEVAHVIQYRLPRINVSREDLENDPINDDEKVFSRYGFEETVRIPELGPVVRMINPPQTYAQTDRQANMLVPRFKHAAITPRRTPWTSRERTDDVISGVMSSHKHRSDSSKPEPEHSPSPVSRSESPAKSIKSIHWMLGSTKHSLFDHKGRSRYQGPFSREFTVTCIAPTNWMRMKWGRSRTTLVQ